jgi:hypothetical protein
MGVCERFSIGEEKDMASAKPSGANKEQCLSHNDLVFITTHTYSFGDFKEIPFMSAVQ